MLSFAIAINYQQSIRVLILSGSLSWFKFESLLTLAKSSQDCTAKSLLEQFSQSWGSFMLRNLAVFFLWGRATNKGPLDLWLEPWSARLQSTIKVWYSEHMMQSKEHCFENHTEHKYYWYLSCHKMVPGPGAGTISFTNIKVKWLSWKISLFAINISFGSKKTRRFDFTLIFSLFISMYLFIPIICSYLPLLFIWLFELLLPWLFINTWLFLISQAI